MNVPKEKKAFLNLLIKKKIESYSNKKTLQNQKD